jgi:hypothetical protein
MKTPECGSVTPTARLAPVSSRVMRPASVGHALRGFLRHRFPPDLAKPVLSPASLAGRNGIECKGGREGGG